MLISNCEPLSLYTYRRSYGKPYCIDQAAEPRTQRQRHCDAHCRNHNSVLFLYVKALSELLVAPIGASSGQRFSNLKNIVQTILTENRRDGATRTTSDSPLCYHSERQSKPRAGLPPVATARSKRPAGIKLTSITNIYTDAFLNANLRYLHTVDRMGNHPDSHKRLSLGLGNDATTTFNAEHAVCTPNP